MQGRKKISAGGGLRLKLDQALEREAASRRILEVIRTSRDDETPVFQSILDSAIKLFDSAHASLWLVNEDRSTLSMVHSNGTTFGAEELRLSRHRSMRDLGNGAVKSVAEQRTIHIPDISVLPRYQDDTHGRRTWVEKTGVRSILAVPLISGDLAIGCLMIFRTEINPYSEEYIDLAESFASQAVIAIENVRQYKALEALNADLENRVVAQVGEIERIGRLKRFLPPAVADAVLSQGSDKLLASHRAFLGVMFCDIRGFTAFCETAEPEETIEVLQTYHEEMGKLIAEHGAGVDTRAGDGIMVLFNDPLPCEDPAGETIRLAIKMHARMVELCKDWKRLGYRLGFGVGISLGYATVGMVGTSGRFDYTASGTAVNLAARLCDKAADGEILISPKAYAAVEADFDAEPTGELNLKGIHAPVQAFRVIGER